MITKEAEDLNHNDTMDDAEVNTRPGDLKYAFTSDGNATEYYYVQSQQHQTNYTWDIDGNTVTLHDKASQYIETWNIESISSSDLKYKTVQFGNDTYWRMYTKQ